MKQHTGLSQGIKIITASILSFGMVFPVILMIISSFKPSKDVFDMRLLPRRITLEGYQKVLEQGFGRYFLNSLIVSLTVTVVALIFHAMAGYVLARVEFKGRQTIFLWILSTLMVPFAVIMIPLFIMMKEFSWINTYAGLIIPAIPHAYGIFLFRQFFMTLPNDLEEAAAIDGCSAFGIFMRIYLPLSSPIIVTLAVAFFIANWNNYLWPLIVSQKKEMWVLQVALSNFVGRLDTPWNTVMASGVTSVLPVIIIFFFLQKRIVDGVKMSGIK